MKKAQMSVYIIISVVIIGWIALMIFNNNSNNIKMDFQDAGSGTEFTMLKGSLDSVMNLCLKESLESGLQNSDDSNLKDRVMEDTKKCITESLTYYSDNGFTFENTDDIKLTIETEEESFIARLDYPIIMKNDGSSYVFGTMIHRIRRVIESPIATTPTGLVTEDIRLFSEDMHSTLLIPEGTVATRLSGAPVDEISLNIMGLPFHSSEAISFVAYDFEPNEAVFSDPGIELTIYYEDAIKEREYDENEIVISWYDEASESEVYLPTTIDTTLKTATANLTHFSSLSLSYPPGCWKLIETKTLNPQIKGSQMTDGLDEDKIYKINLSGYVSYAVTEEPVNDLYDLTHREQDSTGKWIWDFMINDDVFRPKRKNEDSIYQYLISDQGKIEFRFVDDIYEDNSGSFEAAIYEKTDCIDDIDTEEGMKVFGQKTLINTVPNEVTANRVFHPGGVVVDTNVQPNRVYIEDGGNSRILGFASLGECEVNGEPCTNDADCIDESCIIDPYKDADIIFGQPDEISAECNGNNGEYSFPDEETLCSQPYPWAISLMESPEANQMAIDKDSNLFIVDKWNQRVLKFNDPFSDDKTEGKGDTVADYVWGQDSFYKRECNKGNIESPTSSSLCFNNEVYTNHVSGDNAGSGLSVDDDGNIWVADVANNRVLRFADEEKDAEIVIGQDDFESKEGYICKYLDEQTDESKKYLCKPKATAFSDGKLYVLDWPDVVEQFRILIYDEPFSDGMMPSDVIVGTRNGDPCSTKVSVNDIDGEEIPLKLYRPTGIVADPYEEDAIWITDQNDARIIMLKKMDDRWVLRKVISQPDAEKVELGGFVCGDYGSTHFSCEVQPSGGIGIDSEGNIYSSDLSKQMVQIFSSPIPTVAELENTGYPADNQIVMSQFENSGISPVNLISEYGTWCPDSAVVSKQTDRLYVADHYRILFWDDIKEAESGSPATGVLFQEDMESQKAFGQGIFFDLAVDDSDRLWAAKGNMIYIFETPILDRNDDADYKNDETDDKNDEEDYIISFPIKLRDGRNISTQTITGIAYDDLLDVLWVADNTNHRVLRISNPLDLENRYVDMVLGQPNLETTNPNRGQDERSAEGMSCPNMVADGFGALGKVRLDNYGNLYIIDGSHEGWQCSNNRMLEYDAEDLIPDPDKIFFEEGERVPARVYGASGFTDKVMTPYIDADMPNVPISVGFDRDNRMYVVVDAYKNVVDKRVWVLENPLDCIPSEQEIPSEDDDTEDDEPESEPPEDISIIIFGADEPIDKGSDISDEEYGENTCHITEGYELFTYNGKNVLTSQPSDVTFDSDNNLVIMDHTWNRVTYYPESTESSSVEWDKYNCRARSSYDSEWGGVCTDFGNPDYDNFDQDAWCSCCLSCNQQRAGACEPDGCECPDYCYDNLEWDEENCRSRMLPDGEWGENCTDLGGPYYEEWNVVKWNRCCNECNDKKEGVCEPDGCTCSTYEESDEIFELNVLLVEYNPIVDGVNTAEYLFGGDAAQKTDRLAEEAIESFRRLSDDKIMYNIAERIHITEFQEYPDGFKYDPYSLRKCFFGTTQDAELCEDRKWEFNYTKWVIDNNICEIAESNDIDEIWVLSPSFVMTFESLMIGPDIGFGVNGDAIAVPGCNKHMVIMNPTFTDLGNFMHIWGHRIEATMRYLTKDWNDDDKTNTWYKYSNTGLYSLEYGETYDIQEKYCGNAHFPNNAEYHYDYSNHDDEISLCPDWKYWPDYQGITEEINCKDWGCTDTGWQEYWFSSLPDAKGDATISLKESGKQLSFAKNWWVYLLYPDKAIDWVGQTTCGNGLYEISETCENLGNLPSEWEGRKYLPFHLYDCPDNAHRSVCSEDCSGYEPDIREGKPVCGWHWGYCTGGSESCEGLIEGESCGNDMVCDGNCLCIPTQLK